MCLGSLKASTYQEFEVLQLRAVHARVWQAYLWVTPFLSHAMGSLHHHGLVRLKLMLVGGMQRACPCSQGLLSAGILEEARGAEVGGAAAGA